MSDLISRQALRDAMYHEAFETDTEMQRWDSGCWIRYKLFENIIDNLPSAEPERKKGKWIRITKGAIPEKYICPFCHREVKIYGVEKLLPIRYPFCHCGADMRGEE